MKLFYGSLFYAFYRASDRFKMKEIYSRGKIYTGLRVLWYNCFSFGDIPSPQTLNYFLALSIHESQYPQALLLCVCPPNGRQKG